MIELTCVFRLNHFADVTTDPVQLLSTIGRLSRVLVNLDQTTCPKAARTALLKLLGQTELAYMKEAETWPTGPTIDKTKQTTAELGTLYKTAVAVGDMIGEPVKWATEMLDVRTFSAILLTRTHHL